MHRPRLLPVAVALLLLSVPAAAGGPVVLDDPCGDTDDPVVVDPAIRGTGISVGPAEVALAGARVDGFDVRVARLRDLVRDDVATGVEVVLQLCGDVPAADAPASRWAVAWDLPARPGTLSCYGEVRLTDRFVDTGVERAAFLSETCSRPGGVLGGSTASAEYDVALTDWDVSGATITWRLDREADLGPAADQLAPGTPWTGVRADTRDGQQVTEASSGTPTGQSVRASGPGASDRTDRGGDLVVG